MVKNFINNTHFFEWDEATHATYFRRLPDAVEITIPKLPEMAAEQVDLASVPFATFIANKKQSGDPASYSFVLRGYVRHWLDTVWAEYERVGLTDIVEARESPSRLSAGRDRPSRLQIRCSSSRGIRRTGQLASLAERPRHVSSEMTQGGPNPMDPARHGR